MLGSATSTPEKKISSVLCCCPSRNQQKVGIALNMEIVPMTENYLPGSLDVIRIGFFPLESCSSALRITQHPQAQEELLLLCSEAFKDNVSFCAVEKSTGKVVGVAFNKIQVACPREDSFFYKFKVESCKDPIAQELMEFMLVIDAKEDVFEHYGATCSLEVMFLAVLPDYHKNKIGYGLVKRSQEYAAELKTRSEGPNPALVSAIFTSRMSQSIGKKLGWDQLADVSHKEFTIDGETYSQRLGPEKQKSLLMAKKL